MTKRLSLGTLVKHTMITWSGMAPAGKRIVVGTIVGTWSFDSETNERRMHQGEDPSESTQANMGVMRRGYLVLPSTGGGFLYPFFGGLELDVLCELKN